MNLKGSIRWRFFLTITLYRNYQRDTEVEQNANRVEYVSLVSSWGKLCRSWEPISHTQNYRGPCDHTTLVRKLLLCCHLQVYWNTTKKGIMDRVTIMGILSFGREFRERIFVCTSGETDFDLSWDGNQLHHLLTEILYPPLFPNTLSCIWLSMF